MKSLHRRGGRNMRFQPWTSALRFVLAGSLLLTVSVASAGPKEDVRAATMKWGQTLGQNDPDKVVLLYATDGVLWGTLSPTASAARGDARLPSVVKRLRSGRSCGPHLAGQGVQDVDCPAHVQALPQPPGGGGPRVQDKPLGIVLCS